MRLEFGAEGGGQAKNRWEKWACHVGPDLQSKSRFVTGIPVADTTAGFVCYSSNVLKTIELDKIKFVGYAFQIEMKFTAHQCGFKIAEVPIIFVNRELGTSKMSGGIFSEALLGVLKLKIRSWFRKYPQKDSSHHQITASPNNQ